MDEKDFDIKFCQGTENLIQNNESGLKQIKQKIADLSNIKNINFLFGAGVSSGSIPAMKVMLEKIEKDLKEKNLELFQKLKSNNDNNLEKMLGVLYSRRASLNGFGKPSVQTDSLIETIEQMIFEEINIDIESEVDTFNLYKKFYQNVTYRNKDLSRVNIFTTNNDLFNERVLDNLNINYNNGFGGGLKRFFNPSRFGYTYSRKIESSIEKFESLDNMLYLYKLHGSINWIEKKENSLFNIQEINIENKDSRPKDGVLIYPNPLKQNISLGAPYSDLIREFQKKLLLPHSVLFIMGYSFSDEHLNNIIYQALSSNSSISIVIFGNYPDKSICKIDDKRIYKIFGKIGKNKIHYFEYIVNNLVPNLNEDKEKNVLKEFMDKLYEIESTKKEEL